NQNTSPRLELLQKFEFQKTPVMAGICPTGEMIALRPCVENLGLDWSGQLKVIKSSEAFGQLWTSVKAISQDGKTRDMVCLPPHAFQDWLWALNPKSDSFNVELWEQYKKGLVVHLLMMLKISLDEIKRLRRIEKLYHEQKLMVDELIGYNDEALEATRRGRERRKDKNSVIDSLKRSI